MTNRVARIDRLTTRLDFSSATRAPGDARGYVRVWGTVISADTILEYGRADGIDADKWLELVPESTVFDDAALETLRFAPITFLHPPEPLNTGNTGRYSVGSIVDLQRVDGKLRALHLLTDERVIQAARAGVIDLSPGYTMIPIVGDGTLPDGRRYNAIQTARVYNHNAIVIEARAGEGNSLDKLDSLRRLFSVGDFAISKRRKDNKMATITTKDGTTIEVSDEVAAAFAEAQADKATASAADQAAADEAAAAADTAGNEDAEGDPDESGMSPDPKKDGLTRAELDARLDAFATKLVATLDKRDARARADAAARTSLETVAAKVLPKSYKFDGKPDRQIMLDAIGAVSPAQRKRADAIKDASRLRGMFDAVVDSPEPNSPARTDSAPLGGGRQIPATSDEPIRQAAIDAANRRAEAAKHGVGRQALIKMDSAKRAKELN